MDDSGQDFVALCSKLLKRVRKKSGEPRQPNKAEHQSSSQPSEGDKRRKFNKKHCESGSKVAGTQPVSVGAQERLVTGGNGHDSGDAGSSAAAGQTSERGLLAKDKVLQRMQQFKRASPQRMVHDKNHTAINCVPLPEGQIQESSESFSSGLHPEPQDSDEALAFRLQQELDREAAEAQMVDLEDGGLFFCQICHKDLSHMTPEGRTQHINRCLDESEESVPAPPPPLGVPDCPICGKKFKSQKSRSSHLKRCSTDMGISPAVLLQALQRQAEEKKNVPTAHTFGQTGGTKRKGPSKPGHPARKKPRKKTDPLDEDTMVALALSSSLLEQEREQQKEGKGRGKKKGGMPRPPALLLVQDSQTALTRLQERVSALLLRSFSPVPPTPTRCPSTLPGWTGAAPLWQKSSLIDRGSSSQSDFYTPELRQFITPWESAKTDAASSNTSNKPESSLQCVSEGKAVTETTASTLPSTSHKCASCSPTPSTLGTRQLPVGNQALQDLMELAEEGMTLTQCYTASGPDKDKQSSANLSTNLHLSGFVLEETEEQFDLCVSGFLPETAQAHSENPHSHTRRKTDQSGADIERGSHQSVALCRLASDLSSMVNNPQLSDVQLQVDSGDVYFAHSFMVYARCPLLAEMVYESGFGVQEEGMPSAQRVLMSDIPGQAVFALLQYLYTAHCSIPVSLQPHVLELASRFDLQELQQLCKQQREEADYTSQENSVDNQTDQAFVELLRSMWNAEDEGDEEMDIYRARDDERVLEDDQLGNNNLTSGDREIREEKVNEEELKEIYEFAATQRKKEEEDDGKEEKIYEEDDEEDVFTNLSESKGGSSEKSLKLKSELEPDPSLDCSYSSLFSESWGVREAKDPSSLPSTSDLSKAHPALSQQPQSSHKPPAELSCRTLLQSSASVVDAFSLCPPSNTSNLPIPGVSPGQVGGGEGTDSVELDECQPLKQESQGPHSICIPLSPDSPQNKKTEPELIVLSDSSEEMEVVLSSCSPSPRSPCAVQTPQSYTQIKSQQIPKPNEFTCENKKSSSLEFSPGDPVDCSPEVSWLIPSTPVQPERCTRPRSTQTKSSMCRTKLFPKNDSSSPFSVFSSPALSSNRHKTFKSPTRVSAHIGPTEGSVSSVKLDRIVPSSSSLDLNFSPKENNIYDVSKHREPKVSHLSSSTQSHPLRACSKQETPVHLQPQPYSSTPMHTEFNQPPGRLAPSPHHTDPNKKTFRVRERASSESPENTPADLSDPPSSSPCRGLRSLQRHSSSESRHCVESRGHNNSGSELKRRVRVEEMGVRNESAQDLDNEGEQDEVKEESGEVEVAEYSFQQSFMDEPPIAFNDSWGLDACVEENPGCFSLRLEDSRGSSQQERSLGQGETARSSSSTNCQAPPSPHCIQSLETHGSMINTSPSEGHSTQTLTCIQAHTSPSFTLPQPDHTTRTTPEFNSLLDSKIWDSWEEDEQEVALPLSQRVNPSTQLKTPTSSRNKKHCSLVPITPMPHYSDMDTPELKNKLNRFGVRPLPKRQMILKLKEIHQYTHQLVSSDSEDEAPSAGHTAQTKPPATSTASAYSRPISCTQPAKFKEPRVPTAISPVKHNGEVEGEPLSSSQGSNTSTAASEESERSNPELCFYSDGDSDSDGGISSSQAANRLQDRLRAVHTFILSDPALYSQILQYQPVVLSQLQERLRAAGIRLGAAKLVDYLDSQCITFTTAKPGQSAPSRRRGKRIGKAAGKRVSKKKGVTALI